MIGITKYLSLFTTRKIEIRTFCTIPIYITKVKWINTTHENAVVERPLGNWRIISLVVFLPTRIGFCIDLACHLKTELTNKQHLDKTFGRYTCRMKIMKETNKEPRPKKIKIGKEKLVVDVTRLHHGCRLISDWLYIPIRFQHSEENTHNAQQERGGKLKL